MSTLNFPKLVSYKYIGTVNSEKEINRVKLQMTGDSCYIPYVLNSMQIDQRVQILTWKELKEKDPETMSTYLSSVSPFLDRIIQKGITKNSRGDMTDKRTKPFALLMTNTVSFSTTS